MFSHRSGAQILSPTIYIRTTIADVHSVFYLHLIFKCNAEFQPTLKVIIWMLNRHRVGKAQVLLDTINAPVCLIDSVTVGQRGEQDPETEAAKWNSAVINCVIYQYKLSSMKNTQYKFSSALGFVHLPPLNICKTSRHVTFQHYTEFFVWSPPHKMSFVSFCKSQQVQKGGGWTTVVYCDATVYLLKGQWPVGWKVGL